MEERDKNFRAVDQNDQLRLSKWGFQFLCRKKPWLKLFWALIELLLVNIFLVAAQTDKDLEQDDFRWEMVYALVKLANELEQEAPVSYRTRGSTRSSASGRPTSRFEGGLDHHHDIVQEYVTAEQAELNQRIVDDNPAHRESKKFVWRKRDEDRKNGKVRNPMYTSLSACVVFRYVCRCFITTGYHSFSVCPDCRYAHGTMQKTARYCRECQ